MIINTDCTNNYAVNFTATRNRVTGEIIPASVENSNSGNHDDANYGAARAIDMNLSTYSHTVIGLDNRFWLKVRLGQVHCVKEVIQYQNTGIPYRTWSCTENDCSSCEGNKCDELTATVSTEGAVSDLSPVSECKYGDMVMFESTNGLGFYTYEVAVIGHQGEKIIDELGGHLHRNFRNKKIGPHFIFINPKS